MFKELMLKDTTKVEHATQYLSQKTVFTEYAALGRNITRTVNAFLGKPRLNRKLKLFNTPLKKKHLLEIIQKMGGSPSEGIASYSANEIFKKLPKNIRGKVATYILSNVYGNEKVLIDTNSYTVITENGIEKIEGKSPAEKYEKLSLIAKKYGVKLKPYAEIENDKLLVKALMTARTKDEVIRIYEQSVQEKILTDPRFAREYSFIIEKQLRKHFTAGMVTGTVVYMLERIPQLIVTAIARAIARISATLPMVGSIASVNGEIGLAVSEIGYAVGDRVKAMSYMWYHVPRYTSRKEDKMRELAEKYIRAKQEAQELSRLLERANKELEKTNIELKMLKEKVNELEKKLQEKEKKTKKEKEQAEKKEPIKEETRKETPPQEEREKEERTQDKSELKQNTLSETMVQEGNEIEEQIEKQQMVQTHQELFKQQKQSF